MGDFNSLCCDFIEDLGFNQIVREETHGKKILDKIFTNVEDMHIVIFKSLIKTKHAAVLASPHIMKGSYVKQNQKVKVYDFRQPNIDKLRHTMGLKLQNTNFKRVVQYETFVHTILDVMQKTVPSKNVVIKEKDPSYLNPLTKSLLMQRNKLRKAGKTKQADELAIKINGIISNLVKHSLNGPTKISQKTLWRSIRDKTKSAKSLTNNPTAIYTEEEFNDFFVSASYDASLPQAFHIEGNQPGLIIPEDREEIDLIHELNVEVRLKRIGNTAPGADCLPAWLLRSCSMEMAEHLTEIIKDSLATGVVPAQWLTAIVTPIPKVNRPALISDYRPISVTPLLCRVTEQLIVDLYLKPALGDGLLSDQFAYKTSGSTTCALTYFMHSVTQSLESHPFVRCLFIDFSRAFDSVDRNILLSKLCKLPLCKSVLRWIASFLSFRTQCCKMNNKLSSIRSVNKGVTQGSVLGPHLFSVMIADLHTHYAQNSLIKYADDVTELCPSCTDEDFQLEFQHIETWAFDNKLLINKNKTKELVFVRPSPFRVLLPPPLNLIERVVCAKVLGVYIDANLRFTQHVDFVVKNCAQKMFLLRSLKNRGMPPQHLEIIFKALVLANITYALSAWGNHILAIDRDRINAMLKRSFKFGYSCKVLKVEDLLSSFDAKLFNKMQSKSHCLNFLLPKTKANNHKLRERGHSFTLPQISSEIYKKSFLIRSLFDNL